jgi:hypothetical protein
MAVQIFVSDFCLLVFFFILYFGYLLKKISSNFDTLCHSIHLIEYAYYKSNIETTNNNHGNETLK